MKKLLVIITSLMLVLGCANNCMAEVRGGPTILKVKGLYIGMDINEAAKVVSSIMNKPCEVHISGEWGREMSITAVDDKVGILQISASTDKKVKSISLSQSIFNAQDLSLEDFAKQFMQAYQIPGMDGSVDNNGNPLYVFTSSNGYKVTITGGTVFIDAITKKSDLSFN